MTHQEILKIVDHTLLSPTATKDQIKELCDQAIAHSTASICINPCYVPFAVEYLAGRVPVCTVVGFPLGASTTASKVFEAKEAIHNGAAEIDMVINNGFLKSRDYSAVAAEIKAIKEAIGDKILKVIIETCLLTHDEKIRMCHIVEEAGADYIKTSTGFSTGGATPEDISLFHREIGGRVKIKAAGGIKTYEDILKMIECGANRLGSSSAIKIINNQPTDGSY